MRKLLLMSLLLGGMTVAQDCKEIRVLPVECKKCELKVYEHGVAKAASVNTEYLTRLLQKLLEVAGFKLVQNGGSELKVWLTGKEEKGRYFMAEFLLSSKGKEDKIVVDTLYAFDQGEAVLTKGVRALIEKCKP